MRLAGVTIALLMAGCIQDPTIACGDHRCPSGLVCTTTSCATAEDVAACDGKLDHDPCSTTGVPSGACGDGACHAIVCGDNITDPPEVCDDGNVVPGDDCSPTCDSLEVCGNGVVDIIKGETCDEGVNLSQDGCSSQCKVESARWRDVTPAPISVHAAPAMAFDASRNTIVLFGGYNTTTLLDETWEYDGVFWTRLDPPRSPPARAFPAMTYDAKRGVVVMFGGLGGNGHLDDTWTWDGQTWTNVAGSGPPARMQAALQYDAATQTTILFGGANATTVLGDTWEWDGSWTERHPASAPPARHGHGLAFDSSRGTVVLVGGAKNIAEPFFNIQDMWEWNGTTWIDRNVATGPRLSFGALVYDPGNNQLIWFGGEDGEANGSNDRLWFWSGSSWTSSLPTSPATRTEFAMVWDSFHSRAVMFGGITASSTNAETWSYDGGWLQLPNFLQAPLPRFGAISAFDSQRDRGIVVGGVTGSTGYNDVWTWQDHRWSQLPNDPAVLLSGLAYDSDRNVVVLFGGTRSSTPRIDETWELAGSTWTKRTPATTPPARTGPHLAYDRSRKRTVMFGGDGAPVLVDTWEWDGTTWTEMHPATSPPARIDATMAYDEARKRVVLFGGNDPMSTKLADTWEWDGTSWTEMHPVTSPPARSNASITYDANRRHVVVFGGFGTLFFNDVWEWDGTTWTPVVVPPGPPIRAGSTMMYDTRRRELVVFGGVGISGENSELWSLRYSDLATPDEACVDSTADDDHDGLAGCADPDCWGRCSPTCPPATSCTTDAPHCGDGTCGPVEDRKICPQDCP